MPLDFVEFAHHYEATGLDDAARRAEFEVFADFMECIFKALLSEAPAQNRLGIRLDFDTLAHLGAVESTSATREDFNRAAQSDAPGKIDP